MGIVAYVRVSSASQSADMQRAAIKRVAESRGDHIGGWYSETFTGKTTQRPALETLRRDTRAGWNRKLYVWRLDRLTRSGIRDTLELVQEFTRHGCELVSVADGFDLKGPAAEIVLAVMAWAAQMERLAIGERISAARQRVEAAGGCWGRPLRMTPEQRQKAASLYVAGHTHRYIAQALRVPKATIGRHLKSLRLEKVAPVPRGADPKLRAKRLDVPPVGR